MTNRERINELSNGEMAKKIFEYGSSYVCTLCKLRDDEKMCDIATGTDCIQYLKEWLESEAEE